MLISYQYGADSTARRGSRQRLCRKNHFIEIILTLQSYLLHLFYFII